MFQQRRLLAVSAVLLGIGLCLFSASASAAAVATTQGLAGDSEQTDDLRDAIERDGEVRIVISLDIDGSPYIDQAADLDRLQDAVAAAQDELVSSVDSETANDDDFSVDRTYAVVPAVTATVRSVEALDLVVADATVEAVVPDLVLTGSLGTSVPFIGADARQAAGNQGEGVTVAVMDTGVDLDHPDLVDDIIAEACFGDPDGAIDGVGFCPSGSDRQFGAGAAEDDAGHGTHVTGIVTSAGTVSAPGVAPGADIVAIKVLDNSTFAGSGSIADLLAGWDWIITNNGTLDISVLNMSLGGGNYGGDCDGDFPVAATTIANLRSIGVTPFASSGNVTGAADPNDEMTFPACLSDVISVASVDTADNVATDSKSNGDTDLFAPGVNIESLAIGGGTLTTSGTSMASPHAAGCAALLIEAGDATDPDAVETRLETSPFQVTDLNGVTIPRIDCSPEAGAPPVAVIGGPYTTDQGVAITLDASGSSDPDDGPITIAWDLDNDGAFDDATGPTALFDNVAQPGTFTVRIEVTDQEAQTAVAETTVTVANTAPTVTISSNAPVDENTTVTVTGTVTDPGWLDNLSATIDWGDGSSVEPLSGQLENVAPDATFTFQADHVYGDNGTFTVEVCGTDGTAVTCESIDVQVDNVDPTATIDDSAATQFPGGDAIVARAGEPLELSARSTDPGSDDLLLSWDWDDGPPAPDVTTEYRNNPAFVDPLPSPEINPRDVTDTQVQVYEQACLYDVSFTAVDDDGGSAADSVTVVVLGRATEVRSAGYWYQQFRGGPSQKLDDVTLECYLLAVERLSSAFDEARSVSTVGEARQALRGGSAAKSAAFKLDRQLLAAWLNYLNGVIGYDEVVDTDGDGVVDTAFGEAIAQAEAARLDPGSSDKQLLAQKDVLERFNTSAT